jgi:hypothetical protein
MSPLDSAIARPLSSSKPKSPISTVALAAAFSSHPQGPSFGRRRPPSPPQRAARFSLPRPPPGATPWSSSFLIAPVQPAVVLPWSGEVPRHNAGWHQGVGSLPPLLSRWQLARPRSCRKRWATSRGGRPGAHPHGRAAQAEDRPARCPTAAQAAARGETLPADMGTQPRDPRSAPVADGPAQAGDHADGDQEPAPGHRAQPRPQRQRKLWSEDGGEQLPTLAPPPRTGLGRGGPHRRPPRPGLQAGLPVSNQINILRRDSGEGAPRRKDYFFPCRRLIRSSSEPAIMNAPVPNT